MYRTSEAYRAGMRPGDVIVALNGQKVQDPGQLVRLIADAPIGSTAQVDVVRNHQKMTLRVPIVQQRETP